MVEQVLESWKYSTDLWHLANQVKLGQLDWFLRVFGGHRLPEAMIGRVYTLGIPDEMVDATLKSIRSLDDWSNEWVETAQQYLGTYRREVSAGNKIEAEKSRHLAAMCYQAAQIMEVRDLKTRNSCRAWAANLYRLSLPVSHPNARHFTIPWNDQELPVLFEVPEEGDGPFGLVILLNGVSLSKEETFSWAPRFLNAGYAVMAVDSPGTGEATSLGPINPTYTDILDGVFQLLQRETLIDLDRVVLIGASLGGNEAIRIARRNPRIMAVVAVTPAVQPNRWMAHASPMLAAELEDVVPPDDRESMATRFDVLADARELTQPLLIFGAAHDMIVPPNESQVLAAAMADRATFIWYPDQGHCLYMAADQWSWEAATWIAAIGQTMGEGTASVAELAAIGRSAIEHSAYHFPETDTDVWDDDEIGEYARLLDPDEVID